MSVPEKRKAEEPLDNGGKVSKTEEIPKDTDEYEIKEVKEIEQFDYEYNEWDTVLRKKLEDGNSDEITLAFESYLGQYVNDGDKWASYIEWIMNSSKNIEELDKKRIESTFFKVLTKVYNVKLWRLYLKYVELINPITPDNGERARSTVLKAYKFAIETVGIDFFKSHEIWGDYLKYLYLWQTVNPNEVSTREDLIRKALKSMIGYPSLNLEENWKTFIKLETDLNLNKSKNIVAESENDYLRVREVNNELIKLTKSLNPINERKYSVRQIAKWKKWIEWEKENKLKLTDVDVSKRINYVYNLSIQYLRLIPEVWFNYYHYINNEKNDQVKSTEILKDGILTNPTNIVLNYELSKIYEKGNLIENIKEIWTKLIKSLTSENKDSKLITYCYCQFLKFVKRTNKDIGEARKVFKLARQNKNIGWEVYNEYALIEYYNNELAIASRVFSLSMQHFKRDITFVIKYLDFLLKLKDISNFKKIIEISIENFKEIEDNKAIKILFKKYYQVEERFGDINSINSLCKRYARMFGAFDTIKLLYSGLEDVAQEVDNENGANIMIGDKNSVYVLDQYKDANNSSREGSESDLEVTRSTNSNDEINAVIDGLQEDASTKEQVVDENDVAAKLKDFLAALPQEGEMQEQIKSLTIGQLLDFFS